jgi:hypothetical protein
VPTLAAAPRPGNPPDCRRVWSWAVVSMACTALMFAGVARNSPPVSSTVGMREARWGAAAASSGEEAGETSTPAGRLHSLPGHISYVAVR